MIACPNIIRNVPQETTGFTAESSTNVQADQRKREKREEGPREAGLCKTIHGILRRGELFVPQPKAYKSLGPKCQPLPSPAAAPASQSDKDDVPLDFSLFQWLSYLSYSANQGFSLPIYFLLDPG